MLSWNQLREMVKDEKAKQSRYQSIVNYLYKAKEAKSVETIMQMFPDTSPSELAEMARLSLIMYIPRGKYTVLVKAKRA